MNSAIISFVTSNENGTLITKTYRIDFESEADFMNTMSSIERMGGVSNVEKLFETV